MCQIILTMQLSLTTTTFLTFESPMINSNYTPPKPQQYVLQNTKVSQTKVFNFPYLLALCSENTLKVLISWVSNIFYNALGKSKGWGWEDAM